MVDAPGGWASSEAPSSALTPQQEKGVYESGTLRLSGFSRRRLAVAVAWVDVGGMGARRTASAGPQPAQRVAACPRRAARLARRLVRSAGSGWSSDDHATPLTTATIPARRGGPGSGPTPKGVWDLGPTSGH